MLIKNVTLNVILHSNAIFNKFQKQNVNFCFIFNLFKPNTTYSKFKSVIIEM